MNKDVGINAKPENGPPTPFEVEPTRLGRDDLDHALCWAARHGVSDIVLQSGEPISVVQSGEVRRVMHRKLNNDECTDLLSSVVNPDAPSRLKGAKDIAFRHRVRVSREESYLFRGQATAIQAPQGMDSTCELVFRAIPSVPPSCADLELEDEIVNNSLPQEGLVLVTGPTGSGKSTTLAALLRRAAEAEPGRRIITYEHPIEFDLFAVPNRKGTIAQSQIGEHVGSFAEGVQIALRRKPNCILLGEIRDRPTIEGSFVAAQTGHAVYGTLHTNSVASAIPRMTNEFPEESRWSMALNLVETARLIIHQRLVRRKGGGLVALREWLVFDEALRSATIAAGAGGYVQVMTEALRQRKTRILDDAVRKYRMGLLDDEAMSYYRQQYAAEYAALMGAEAQPGHETDSEEAGEAQHA